MVRFTKQTGHGPPSESVRLFLSLDPSVILIIFPDGRHLSSHIRLEFTLEAEKEGAVFWDRPDDSSTCLWSIEGTGSDFALSTTACLLGFSVLYINPPPSPLLFSHPRLPCLTMISVLAQSSSSTPAPFPQSPSPKVADLSEVSCLSLPRRERQPTIIRATVG